MDKAHGGSAADPTTVGGTTGATCPGSEGKGVFFGFTFDFRARFARRVGNRSNKWPTLGAFRRQLTFCALAMHFFEPEIDAETCAPACSASAAPVHSSGWPINDLTAYKKAKLIREDCARVRHEALLQARALPVPI